MSAYRAPSVAVSFDHVRWRDIAEGLAQQLSLPIAKKFNDPHDVHLAAADDERSGHRLELRVNAADHPLAGGRGVSADLTKLDTSSGAGRSLKSPLAKAVGIKRGQRPTVCDATGGWGEDTWLLAAAGCTITVIERQPIVHALLGDALRRAHEVDPETAGLITLAPCGDASVWLTQSIQAASPGESFETVLLDPMFPGAAKRKTAERKPLRLLRWLAGDDVDAERLFPAAMAAATRRVVVKRPAHAPPLGDRPPASQHAGRGFRFDVHPVNLG